MLHEDATLETGATVGHSAIVHDATVAEGALVGMNAVVLDGAHVGENAVVAAGSVVTEGTEIPASTLVAGTPAEEKGDVDDPRLEETADRYAEAKRHVRSAERIE